MYFGGIVTKIKQVSEFQLVRMAWPFLSVNFFRQTMHSKSPVVNLAEPSWNTFGEQVNSCVQQSIEGLRMQVV